MPDFFFRAKIYSHFSLKNLEFSNFLEFYIFLLQKVHEVTLQCKFANFFIAQKFIL